jgi:NAD+ kinase
MKTLGVTANVSNPRAAEVLHNLASLAPRHGVTLVADRATARLAGKGMAEAAAEGCFGSVEAVIAIGGDGTMLRAVRELDGRDIPIMGLNIGSLGFLTSVQEDDMDKALRCLAENEFTVGVRSMAECRAFDGDDELGRYRALNDVVIRNGPSSRVIGLDLEINRQAVTRYVCDGLIVSTPTGSTGHSLSAGGPIVCPETRAFVISLICPHTLSSRPLVVPDTSAISVTASEAEEAILLTIDGQVGMNLGRGARIDVRVSDRHVSFIHLPGHSQFSVLRQKLHWSGSNV